MPLRLAVVGHVEHVTIGRVPALHPSTAVRTGGPRERRLVPR